MPDTTTDYARGFRAGIEATERLRRYVEMRGQQRGSDDVIHTIHGGTEHEVELRLSDLVSVLAPAAPEPSEDEKAYLRDQTCILRKGKNGDTVICGQSVVEGHLRQGYQFDWKATDEARARDRAALAAAGRV